MSATADVAAITTSGTATWPRELGLGVDYLTRLIAQ
jgi:hypothetical protein